MQLYEKFFSKDMELAEIFCAKWQEYFVEFEYRTLNKEQRMMKFLPFNILHSLFVIHYSFFGSGLPGYGL